ncbi:MAG: DNA-3-methyladenine glycosylase [Solirubrobacterales bacterium]
MTGARSEPRLTAAFYSRPVVDVARDLIGCRLFHGRVGGVIVETEAYHEIEPAAHSYRGPTPRAEVLFRAPGTAYVYFGYGVHHMLNAVCEAEGVGAAVLIRALAPTDGLDLMRERRRLDRPAGLCSGPGKLTEALAVGLDLNGSSLLSGPVAIFDRAEPIAEAAIARSGRIGITKATELPWRFYLRGDRNVSRSPRS